VIGKSLPNRYHLDAKVSHGGMDSVYRATDTLTGELVAVKVLDQTSEVSKTSEV
jgi:serine/threonine protein kinase